MKRTPAWCREFFRELRRVALVWKDRVRVTCYSITCSFVCGRIFVSPCETRCRHPTLISATQLHFLSANVIRARLLNHEPLWIQSGGRRATLPDLGSPLGSYDGGGKGAVMDHDIDPQV